MRHTYSARNEHQIFIIIEKLFESHGMQKKSKSVARHEHEACIYIYSIYIYSIYIYIYMPRNGFTARFDSFGRLVVTPCLLSCYLHNLSLASYIHNVFPELLFHIFMAEML